MKDEEVDLIAAKIWEKKVWRPVNDLLKTGVIWIFIFILFFGLMYLATQNIVLMFVSYIAFGGILQFVYKFAYGKGQNE